MSLQPFPRLTVLGLLAALLLAVSAGPLVATEPLSSIPNPRERDGTWVTDMPPALRADTAARLNQAISATEQSHGIEMAVVVVQSLDGLTIEDAAEKLFQLWGIGKKGQDNGLLFLWSTGDRKVRVEVGYGLEGVLPDGAVGAILDRHVIPRFRTNDFDGGVIAGVDALLATARRESPALPALERSYEALPGQLVWWSLLGVVPVGVAVTAAYRRWRRYRRRKCPRCRTKMTLLPDYEDDALLQDGQVAEERVGSVDYDVWKCPACEHHLTLRYAKLLSKYDKCPQCSNKTKSSTESVTQSATEYSTGLATVLESCAFCTYTNEYTKVLPRITESSSSSSSGGGGGGSLGGGSSGGGGASRGY